MDVLLYIETPKKEKVSMSTSSRFRTGADEAEKADEAVFDALYGDQIDDARRDEQEELASWSEEDRETYYGQHFPAHSHVRRMLSGRGGDDWPTEEEWQRHQEAKRLQGPPRNFDDDATIPNPNRQSVSVADMAATADLLRRSLALKCDETSDELVAEWRVANERIPEMVLFLTRWIPSEPGIGGLYDDLDAALDLETRWEYYVGRLRFAPDRVRRG